MVRGWELTRLGLRRLRKDRRHLQDLIVQPFDLLTHILRGQRVRSRNKSLQCGELGATRLEEHILFAQLLLQEVVGSHEVLNFCFGGLVLSIELLVFLLVPAEFLFGVRKPDLELLAFPFQAVALAAELVSLTATVFEVFLKFIALCGDSANLRLKLLNIRTLVCFVR